MPSDPQLSDILAAITDIDLKDVDLNNCDREPIHTPNLIQPHGILIALCAEKYNILQVSVNTEQLLGIKPQELLGQSLTTLLGEKQVAAIKNCLEEDVERPNLLPLELIRGESTLNFDGIVHRNGEIVILELEPSMLTQKANFDDFYRFVKSPINRLQKSNNLEELCNVLAQEIKTITGFDRVMVYNFDEDGSGEVIAEAAKKGLQSFLGLHYPATDIPRQAKYLFTLKSLRLIPDVASEPVAITPELNPLTKERLDMSMTVLRSVSPFHIEYLNNMGVAATLVISLIKNKQLWGLISCHHHTPKKVDYEIRSICEFFGQVASSELAAKEENQDLDYKIRLKSIQTQFIGTISAAEDLETGLTKNPQHLLDLVGADGAALSLGKEIVTVGHIPDKEFIAAMLPWLETQFNKDIIYATDSLWQAYPAAQEHKATASGLMALSISQVQKIAIIWFRAEVIQTVNWAGEPNQPEERDENGILLLSPRTSFSLWKETVQGKSLPWKSCEVEIAIELRSSIVGIVLRKADELTQLNQELSRSNSELDAFAYIASHDLKEPLRGIYNYSSFLIEDYGEILGDDGADKLNTLMRLTHRMEDLINSLLHYSRLGRAELLIKPVELNDLVAGVLDVIQASARDTQVEFKIPHPLPTIKCDRTQVNELLTNLISNGIKYNQQDQKIIEIGYLDPDEPIAKEKMLPYSDDKKAKTIFYVRDNGIGIRERHIESIFRIFKRLHGQKKYGGGTGAGLTIAKKIVERHGGEIWVKSVYQQGSTFYFTLQ